MNLPDFIPEIYDVIYLGGNLAPTHTRCETVFPARESSVPSSLIFFPMVLKSWRDFVNWDGLSKPILVWLVGWLIGVGFLFSCLSVVSTDRVQQ